MSKTSHNDDETRDLGVPAKEPLWQPPAPVRPMEPHAEADPQPSQLDFGIAAGFGLSASTELRPPTEPPTEVGMLVGGKYKLIQAIGEGGMGSVWLAEQKEPVRRKVAIKLVKAGMDSRQVLARFEAERQALAMMDHPNIAKVLDGGVTDRGRPYFAMELVKGIPLTEYCDQVQFSIRERLELFGQVCSAVQHAHQKGIIHRDLKPSNVLAEGLEDSELMATAEQELAEWYVNSESVQARDARLSRVLNGTESPGDLFQRLELALHAYETKRFRVAVELFSGIIEAFPKSVENHQLQLRYNAACCALRAISEEDRTEPPLDSDTKAQLRAQALAWLQAELESLAALLQSDSDEAKSLVSRTLQHWQQDPDLESVRSDRMLEKLPSKEQDGFRRLWDSVAALLARSQE